MLYKVNLEKSQYRLTMVLFFEGCYEKLILKKVSRRQQKHKNHQACKERIRILYLEAEIEKTIIVPTKSDSDVILCLQLLSKIPLELTRIDRSLVY